MKHLLAIVLLSLPGLLAAKESCVKPHAERFEDSGMLTAKPPAKRIGVSRTVNLGSIPAWQRAVLFEQQIL